MKTFKDRHGKQISYRLGFLEIDLIEKQLGENLIDNALLVQMSPEQALTKRIGTLLNPLFVSKAIFIAAMQQASNEQVTESHFLDALEFEGLPKVQEGFVEELANFSQRTGQKVMGAALTEAANVMDQLAQEPEGLPPQAGSSDSENGDGKSPPPSE